MCSFRFSLCFPSALKPPSTKSNRIITCGVGTNRSQVEIAPFSYQKFVDFAVDETNRRTALAPSPTQVLDFGIFPKVEYDLPIFCANFFTNSAGNIVVLDLNPLYDVISNIEYKNKYYQSLLHLGLKYSELLPWGGKITGESMRFFSPIILWTRFSPSQDKHDVLFTAFKDYFRAWLELMERAEEEANDSHIICNREAQHKYLTWRTEKDPGHQLLKRLIGEDHAKDLLRNFLFKGVDELGSKSFLDYFPEYRLEDGKVSNKRSMIGKSFEHRPWDDRGEFIG